MSSPAIAASIAIALAAAWTLGSCAVPSRPALERLGAGLLAVYAVAGAAMLQGPLHVSFLAHTWAVRAASAAGLAALLAWRRPSLRPAGVRPAAPRRRNRSGRAHGPARVALPGREPPRLPPGHAVARGLDPPAPRRRPRAGRRVRRRAQLVPMALPLADGLDRPGAPGRRRRSARRRRRPRPRHDRGGYVAPRPRARRRRPGRGRCDGPRGRRGWLRLGVAARPRCGAQHERRRPGPLSRRPGALERPRARDGEPAAARAPRPGSVHGAARPVGVRPCAGRPLANGAPRSGRGRRARVPVRAACGPLPRRVGSGACAAGPRAARRLDRARGRAPSQRSGSPRWPSPTTATAASSTSPRWRRRTRPSPRRLSRSGSRSRSASPASCSRCGRTGGADPWRIGLLVAVPAAACIVGVAVGEGGTLLGSAALLRWLRYVPFLALGLAVPAGIAAERGLLALRRIARPAAVAAIAAGVAAAVASTALAAVELGRAPAPATLQCRSLPIRLRRPVRGGLEVLSLEPTGRRSTCSRGPEPRRRT